MNAEQTIDTAKSLQRVQNYLERLEVAKGYHKECIHAFIDKNGDEIPLLVADLKAILQQVAATQPAAQRMDAQTLKHISALSELVRMPNAEHFSDAHNAAVRHLRSLADTTAAWVRPVSELLGHISDVLPDNAFDKIDTVKWNAVSALVGATTQAAAALILAEIERMDRSFSAQAKKGAE